MKHKQTPGPVGQSCLTCRRRRKKCDKRRPLCERCRVGGFNCLGYDCEEVPSTRLSLGRSPREPVQPGGPDVQQHPHLHRPLQGLPQRETIPTQANGGPYYDALTLPYMKPVDPPVDSFFAYDSNGLPMTPRWDNHGAHVSHGNGINSGAYPTDPPELWNTPNTRRSTTTENSIHLSSWSPTTAPIATVRFPPGARSARYVLHLPQTLSDIPANMLGVINFVLAQYDKLFSLSYFRPVHEDILRIRSSVTQRLLRPFDNSRWVLVLGAKMIDSFLDGTLDHKSKLYQHWIKIFEQDLQIVPNEQLAEHEVECRLTSSMEIAFFKLRIADTFSPYQVLRGVVPTFLKIAFSDLTLWPSQHNLTAVSVAHILASERHELGHFIHLDSLCSMVYGMPQVLEYDTSTPPFHPTKLPVQSCPICPVVLQIALIDMNNLCGQMYIGDDWRSIEQRILTWEAPIRDTAGVESWKVITHLAIEETWRQTLLIYLYMAVCGVSSDDPRVQSSVRQVFRLIESIKGQTISFVHQYFFMQYIVAGACTRFESQRALARERLADTRQHGLCLLRGSDFVPVLDHLWHGAAADGRAIRWSDYLISRQAVLPVDF